MRCTEIKRVDKIGIPKLQLTFEGGGKTHTFSVDRLEGKNMEEARRLLGKLVSEMFEACNCPKVYITGTNIKHVHYYIENHPLEGKEYCIITKGYQLRGSGLDIEEVLVVNAIIPGDPQDINSVHGVINIMNLKVKFVKT